MTGVIGGGEAQVSAQRTGAHLGHVETMLFAGAPCPFYVRRRGRVRQVGPPEPFRQSSEPGKVRTSKPASRRRLFVLAFSSRASRRLLPSERTMQIGESPTAQ